MPTYVFFINFTEQGIKNLRDTVRRAEDARGLIERHGGQLRQLLWTAWRVRPGHGGRLP
jgi:uncharacterized protein with GYD domain